MANHLATRAAWFDNTNLLYTELADLDAKTVDSISATGGTYALTEVLTIGGAPGVFSEFDTDVVFGNDVFIGPDPSTFLIVNSVATFASEATFSEAVTFDNTTDFNGSASFHGGVLVGDNAADTLIVAASATALSPWGFDDQVTFDDIATFNGFGVFQDTAFFNAGAEFADTVEFQAPIEFSGAGKVKWRTKSISVSGAQSVVAAQYDYVRIPSGVMAGNFTITIDDTGAEDGMAIEFFVEDISHVTTIETPAALAVDLRFDTATYYNSVKFVRMSGGWHLSAPGKS